MTISGCGGYGARFDVLLIILIRKVTKSLSDKNSGKCRLIFKFYLNCSDVDESGDYLC